MAHGSGVEADARVQPSVGNVDQQVHAHQKNAVNDHDASEEKHVSVEDRIDEERTGSREVKQGFYNNGSSEEVGGEWAQIGDDGQESGFQSVDIQDAAFGDPFGASGSEEGSLEGFQKGGSREASNGGNGGAGEGDGGKDEA